MIIVYLTTFDIRHIPGHYVVAFSRRIVLGARRIYGRAGIEGYEQMYPLWMPK